MAIGKWIGGLLGWMHGGPIGLLAGIFIGSLFDKMVGGDSEAEGVGSRIFEGDTTRTEGDRNSFLFSMLVLASYIIKADGRVMHSEMEFVRQMLRQNFGEVAAQQGDQILRRLFEESKHQGDANFKQTIRQSCQQIARNVDYSGRLQLLNFLVMIAKADGQVHPTEIAALKEVARWMQMSDSEVDSMLHLEGSSLDDAYKVLGISPDATDDEVKRAYRRLALEHHPDRVAKLGEDVRRAAEKKFQEINAAKERIYKARGL